METGRFCRNGDIKNEAESGFRRPEKKRRLFRYTALSQIFMFNVQVSDIAVLTSHRAEAGACTTSSILFAVHITEFRDVFDTDFLCLQNL